MKQIRKGEGGEVTAEIFETMFPDKPELILFDFLKTGQTDIWCVVRLDEKDICITHITRNYAKKLLDEFKTLRGIK